MTSARLTSNSALHQFMEDSAEEYVETEGSQIMQKIQAYIVGALLMFGSATWAAIYAENVSSVIAILSIPSLLAGYIYGTALPQYAWGMLLGICSYMVLEFFMYGPVYQTTGLVYGIAFFTSLGCATVGYALLRWKTGRMSRFSD